MRLRFLITIFVLMIAAIAARAAERLHDITTLEDLRKLDPVHLDDNWDVRVGLAEGGKDAGPWRVLYCLATCRKDDPPAELLNNNTRRTPDHDRGGSIGPLTWELINKRDADGGGLRRVMAEMASLSMSVSEPPREYLFAQTMPLAEKGAFVLKVSRPQPAGATLWETVLEVTEPEPATWRELVDQSARNDGEAVVSLKGAAVYPTFDSTGATLWFTKSGSPMLPFSDVEERKQSAQEEPLEEERGNLLPGAIPLAPMWQDLVAGNVLQARREGKTYPLKLALDEDVLVITSPARIFSEIDEHFLVRWWINAKPVLADTAQKSDGEVSRSFSGRVEWRDTVRVKLRLPDYLGELAEGDVVRAQVLYCPQGYWRFPTRDTGAIEELRKLRLHEVTPTFPLQSNTVKFEVTAEMLKAREKK